MQINTDSLFSTCFLLSTYFTCVTCIFHRQSMGTVTGGMCLYKISSLSGSNAPPLLLFPALLASHWLLQSERDQMMEPLSDDGTIPLPE